MWLDLQREILEEFGDVGVLEQDRLRYDERAARLRDQVKRQRAERHKRHDFIIRCNRAKHRNGAWEAYLASLPKPEPSTWNRGTGEPCAGETTWDVDATRRIPPRPCMRLALVGERYCGVHITRYKRVHVEKDERSAHAPTNGEEGR